MTGDGSRRHLRIVARRRRPPGVARTGEHLVELGLQHGFKQFANSIPKPSFDRVELVVEKPPARLHFRLRLARRRAMARHGVISTGAQTPGSLVAIKLEITPRSFSNHSRYGT